jgi:hypothetical protein
VCGEHRKINFGVEPDDRSVSSDSDESIDASSRKKKINRAGAKVGAGAGTDRDSLVAFLKKAGLGDRDVKQLLKGKDIVTRVKTKPRGEKWNDWEEIGLEGCHAWIHKDTNEIRYRYKGG